MTTEYVAVTGATGAIGKEITLRLIAEHHPVLLLCRNPQRMAALAEELTEKYPAIPLRTALLNLEDEADVRRCVDSLKGLTIKGLINNAGVMNRHYQLDCQGRELTLAVNYYNTALLAHLLLATHPELATIVFTTSMTRRLHRHYRHTEQPTVTPQQFSQLGTYALSKRLITDYAKHLAAQHPECRINCADPGIVNSSMIHMDRWYDPIADRLFRPFIRTAAKGADPALRAFHAAATSRIFCRHLTY